MRRKDFLVYALNYIFLFLLLTVNSKQDQPLVLDKNLESERNCFDESCSGSTEKTENETTDDLDFSAVPVYDVDNVENHLRIPNNLTCTSDTLCSALPAECIVCNFNFTCIYGKTLNVTCYVSANSKCKGNREFIKLMTCQYCYQTSIDDHDCSSMGYCTSTANPIQYYRSNCTVKPHVVCLGKRKFYRNTLCNWTSGYKWTTALLLSITLGGFGADRFYLGYWQEGIGKLFSFGGAGVWTLIDVILIAVGYLKPADGSLYI